MLCIFLCGGLWLLRFWLLLALARGLRSISWDFSGQADSAVFFYGPMSYDNAFTYVLTMANLNKNTEHDKYPDRESGRIQNFNAADLQSIQK